MKTMVIYKSATGFTREYAQWIAEALSAELFAAAETTLRKMQEYDCIVFGGRLYAVGIDGISFITKNFEKLKGKKLIVFATGASPSNETVIQEVRNKNLTLQQQTHVEFFYLRGGFNFKALPLFDKILMSLLKNKITRKQKKGVRLTSDEAGMLALYDKQIDFTKKENINVIIEAVRLD
ncbi:MAG: flavodoxin domain-containing protein [Christensenellales bacterium]